MRARPQSSNLQGKKRVYGDITDEKNTSITVNKKGKEKAKDQASPPPTPIRKPRRAETRPCPVCEEAIPLRLMGRHAQLESERVDQIISQIGSSEPLLLADEFDDLCQPGSSSGARSRRSALKALKSFTSTSSVTNDQLSKTIQTIQRRRKQRHARFKEMAREEEEGYSEHPRWARRNDAASDEVICPVCSRGVRGDQEVIETHVDACLADENRRSEEDRARSTAQDLVVVDGEWDPPGTISPDGAAGHVGNVRGMGFHTRDPTSQDVDDEIDIDGDDQETYGDVQFTERDILAGDEDGPLGTPYLDTVNVDEAGSAQMTLRDLIAEGRVIQRQAPHSAAREKVGDIVGVRDFERVDQALLVAKSEGNKKAIIAALEDKIKHLESLRLSSSTSLLCRICLDPYNEPTVSTGCWHTCCRECWLRCLGSTKLCPICKRITGAADLRRIYL